MAGVKQEEEEEQDHAKKPDNKKRKAIKDEEDEGADDEHEMKRNDDGEAYIELSSTRRVSVRLFKKKVFVDIREYYTNAEGAMKPGKKGISLPVDQFNALSAIIKSSKIDDEISKLQK